MDILQFIVEMTNTLAWPVASASIAFMFKGEIAKLLLRLRKLRHKDTELEFTEGIQALVQESEQTGESIHPPNLDDEEIRTAYDFLLRLADISPRAAVIEAYRKVELSAYDLVNGLSINKHKLPPSRIFNLLREGTDILDDHTYSQLRILKDLRNQAAHAEELDLKDLQVEVYIDIALAILAKLKQSHKKK